MAKKPIDYLYSAYSAYAYIGHGAFLQIAREANRPVIHRPFDLMKCLNAILGMSTDIVDMSAICPVRPGHQ